MGVLQHGGVNDCRSVDRASCDEHVWQKVVIIYCELNKLDFTGQHRWSSRVEVPMQNRRLGPRDFSIGMGPSSRAGKSGKIDDWR
jgi:hypothetical protein